MDDLELINTFREHVDPPDEVRTARARRRLVDEFDRAPALTPRRRRRSRPALAALVAAATALAAGALAIAGVFGGGGATVADAAIIHRADAALTPPPNEILHTEVAGDGFAAETWQLTSPPYSFLGYKGPAGQPVSVAASDGAQVMWWDPATNTIHEQATTKQPKSVEDPLAEVRAELRAGNARVVGSATVDGKDTYKIQFEDKNGYDSQSLIAYVDKGTYRPILLSDPQSNGDVVQLRVVALEYLSATPANMRLLSLTALHPGAKVVSGGSAIGATK
jgi:hypothetical protein